MKTISKITGRAYDPHEIINILNLDQVDFYINEMGVPLQDISFSPSKRTGKTMAIYMFNRSDTREPFDRWCRRGEKNEE